MWQILTNLLETHLKNRIDLQKFETQLNCLSTYTADAKEEHFEVMVDSLVEILRDIFASTATSFAHELGVNAEEFQNIITAEFMVKALMSSIQNSFHLIQASTLAVDKKMKMQ